MEPVNIETGNEQAARAGLQTIGALIDFHAAQRRRRPRSISMALRSATANGRRVRTGSRMPSWSPVRRASPDRYLGKNDSRYFEALVGCGKAGMVLTPISWRLALPEILFLLEDFDTEVLIIDRDYLGNLSEIRAARPSFRRLSSSARRPTTPRRSTHGVTATRTPIPICRDGRRGAGQLHTSGTTGRPKGAMLTHANMLWAARRAETGELTHWDENDLSLVPLPLFHSGGTCWSLYAIYVGGGIYITREAGPDHVLARSPRTDHQGRAGAGTDPDGSERPQIRSQPDHDAAGRGLRRLADHGRSPAPGHAGTRLRLHPDVRHDRDVDHGDHAAPEDHDLERPHL